MKFNLHERFGALNSKPVFDAFHAGANALGHDVVVNGNDGIDVIWSVLWNGRMAGNQAIWERNKACLLYTSPSPRDATLSRMPSSA